MYLCFIACGWVNIYGQQELTLEECKILALKNNTEIKNGKLEIEDAKQVKLQASGKYFPSVNAIGGAFYASKGLIETEIMPGVELSMIKKGVVGGVVATQPLYTGGQISNTNLLATLNIDAKSRQLEQAIDVVIQTTEKYYWQYFLLMEKLKTLDVIEKLVENTYKDAELSVKEGLIINNDLLQIQLKKDEIAGNRLQIENNMQLTKGLLAQYIGIQLSDFTPANVIEEKLPPPTAYKANHEEALKGTVTYKLLDMNVKSSKLQTKLEIGKYMPTVAVGAAYMYHNLLGKDQPFGMVYTTVSVPISDWWSGSHAIRQKKLREKIAENNSRNTKELLIIQMQQLYSNLEVYYKQVQIAQRSIENAKETVRLNTNCYKTGTSSLTSLLDAQSSLQQTRDNYVEKYTNYLLERSEYQRKVRAH